GLAFYLNQGLYVGLRVNYGLSDLTRTERDVSRKELDDSNNFIFREDKDRNLTLQASVGFSF
ncbi:MAG: PorT family protein, partial [Phaeodactylibacter sp.]|nr:PorT family protein [Phaeodactylibacter sp.]